MLTIPGVDPSRIKCKVDQYGVHRVHLDDWMIVRLHEDGPLFDGSWSCSSSNFRRDAIAVMNACIDEWRASGGKRLWPEPPPPQPVDCVCGARAYLYGEGGYVECERDGCRLGANNVAEWNPMQDALKKLKEAT